MRRNFRALLIVAVAGLAAGCAGLGEKDRAASANPAADRAAQQAAAVTGYLETLQRLIHGGAAEQAEILADLRRDYETTPTASHELLYSLALATPGHVAWNLSSAQSHLRQLTAAPEALQPAERSLAILELQGVDQQLRLAAENARLRGEAERLEREHATSASRRLQAEIDENVRLRKQLEEAQAKLDAIANIERSITEPKSPNRVRRQ
ncbi:MAG: hypothetical protein WCE48_00925 [Steroidobacteraceae bacterium]